MKTTQKRNLIRSLRPLNVSNHVFLCQTCRMELLPFKDEDGYHSAPHTFCDEACRRMFRLYHGVFAKKARDYPQAIHLGIDYR